MRRGNVTVGGRAFLTDPTKWSWRTVEVTRRGSDQGAGAGEQSLSNEQVWRRTRESWHLGAGQDFADVPDDSDPFRFADAHGCDPWTKRGLTLLADTALVEASANTNLLLGEAAGTHLYLADGATLQVSTDGSTFTATDYAGGTILDLTAGAGFVWVTDGANIWRGTPGGSFTSWSAVDADVIEYANGRLVAADANELLEVDAAGAETVVFTHPSTNFAWRGFAGTPGNIYGWGDDGSRTEVYGIGLADATGALAVPFHAMPLPDGELVRAMVFYGGIVAIGTSRGLRLALLTGGGFLSHGPVIEIAGNATVPGVECLEGQGEDLWFGWADATHGAHFDQAAAHSCLGRARLSRFTDDLVPAYAEDLVANNAGVATGRVRSVATFDGRRFFTVAGIGVFRQADTYVAGGQLDSGWFSWSIPERKQPDFVRVDHDALVVTAGLAATVHTEVGDDVVDVTATTGSTTASGFPSGDNRAERARAVVSLSSSSPFTAAPVLRRLTVGGTPAPFLSDEIVLPLRLADRLEPDAGARFSADPLADWQFLVDLRDTQERVELVVGDVTRTVKVAEVGVVNGGLGGGNGLDGWADRERWTSGEWQVRFVTMETA